MRNWLSASCLTLCVFLVSCASEREVTYEKGKTEQFGDRYMSDVKYVTDENGNVRPSQDKRSQYDSKGGYAGAKGFSGSQYGKESYRSKRWGGNKGFNAQQFSGSNGNQYQQTPHFVQKQSELQGSYSRHGNQGYSTQAYQSNAPAVSRGRNASRPADAATQARRDSYVSPPVFQREQVNQIGVEDTNAMLGR